MSNKQCEENEQTFTYLSHRVIVPTQTFLMYASLCLNVHGKQSAHDCRKEQTDSLLDGNIGNPRHEYRL